MQCTSHCYKWSNKMRLQKKNCSLFHSTRMNSFVRWRRIRCSASYANSVHNCVDWCNRCETMWNLSMQLFDHAFDNAYWLDHHRNSLSTIISHWGVFALVHTVRLVRMHKFGMFIKWTYQNTMQLNDAHCPLPIEQRSIAETK